MTVFRVMIGLPSPSNVGVGSADPRQPNGGAPPRQNPDVKPAQNIQRILYTRQLQ